MTVTLHAIVEALGGELHGDGALPIRRLAPLETAGADELSFIAQARYASRLDQTRAGALIVPPDLADAARARGSCIATPDPYLYFARLTQWWKARVAPPRQAAIHPSAAIAPGARLGLRVSVGPFAVIEDGAVIGDGASVGAHAVVEARAVVGAGSDLRARVVLGHDCRIGERCLLHAGVVIGADGFGFAPDGGRWVKIEQLGAVQIGDDVEIGANSCVDRGALGDTVLADGVKLDNLIQIGHNVQVGAHTAMAGCVGVAGSARIGAHCTIGGGAVVLGHLTLADHVHISAASVVTRSILQPGQYSGVFPIDDNRSWERNAATLRQLHALRDRIRALERPT